MKILIINGHNSSPYAKGQLNHTLFEKMIELLAPHHSLLTTIVEKGYDINEEAKKFQTSDLIIYQMPIHWFSFPHLMKRYLDEVYLPGIFYGSSEKYGQGGLMKGKKYMFSLTWNAPYEAFHQTSGFMDSRGVEEVIISMHKAQEYCGFEKLPTYSCFNVVKKTNVPQYLKDLELHLNKYILNSI